MYLGNVPRDKLRGAVKPSGEARRVRELSPLLHQQKKDRLRSVLGVRLSAEYPKAHGMHCARMTLQDRAKGLLGPRAILLKQFPIGHAPSRLILLPNVVLDGRLG